MSAETLDTDSFDLSRKKKSKKQIKRQELVPEVQPEKTMTNDDDFSYEFLLDRLIDVIGDQSDQTLAKINVPLPMVGRLGTRRTTITNFGSICKALNRPEKMLQDFFIVELGTTASIDSNHALLLRARLKQSQVETILKSFIRQYVQCKNCHSPSTSLHREDRLTVLQCDSCLSKYTVSNIRSHC